VLNEQLHRSLQISIGKAMKDAHSLRILPIHFTTKKSIGWGFALKQKPRIGDVVNTGVQQSQSRVSLQRKGEETFALMQLPVMWGLVVPLVVGSSRGVLHGAATVFSFKTKNQQTIVFIDRFYEGPFEKFRDFGFSRSSAVRRGRVTVTSENSSSCDFPVA
jgi:hypothetical protein